MFAERGMEAGSNTALLASSLSTANITQHLLLLVTILIGSANTSTHNEVNHCFDTQLL